MPSYIRNYINMSIFTWEFTLTKISVYFLFINKKNILGYYL